jgi:preprotein translocase subunit SecF
MIEFFKKIDFDWMGKRQIFIAISILILLGGLTSAIVREAVPGGTDAFNLGVDFQGGTVLTTKFKSLLPPKRFGLRSRARACRMRLFSLRLISVTRF